MRSRKLHAVLLGLSVCFAGTLSAADWPQWRGPDRSNVSRETGLAGEWPEDGPPLAWKATGLGDGVVPVSVAGGRIFTTGNVDGEVICVALAEKTGKELWRTTIGPAPREMSIMRWLVQAAPTVDGELLHVVTTNGDYACLATDSGKIVWRKNYLTDLKGKKGPFGYCDYPLADGDRLIICPGGDESSVAALDRKTGRVVWTCPIVGESSAHSVSVMAEIDGVKQYIVHLAKAMYGISTDGKLLWTYAKMGGRYQTQAPIVRGNEVFYASSSSVLLEVSKANDTWTAQETYWQTTVKHLGWLGSSTQNGDHILVNTLTGLACLEWKSGKPLWEEKLGRCMYTLADGKLFIRDQKGKVILARADVTGYRKLSEFTVRQDKGLPAWTFPVIANGRLYIRDYDTVFAYDVRDPDRPRKRAPDAVFVPTPPDVVKRMLELVAVKKDDVVYDLGSGDGRIVIAAAKTYGCKAVGVEIDKELVATARERAKKAGVEKLVTFEHGDLFEADFSSASVVALYILPTMSKKLIPKIDKLKPGARVVSHVFAIPGMIPDRVVKMTSEEDDVERPIYLYTVPLRKEKK